MMFKTRENTIFALVGQKKNAAVAQNSPLGLEVDTSTLARHKGKVRVHNNPSHCTC